MTIVRLWLLVATSAWVAGNGLLLVVAKVLFTPGLTHAFAYQRAPGVVFGACLAQWTTGVTWSLLPVTEAGVLVLSLRSLMLSRKLQAVLWLAGGLLLLGSHVWSADLVERVDHLLPGLQKPGPLPAEFRAAHRESLAAFMSESVCALALLIAAGSGVLRPSAPSVPKPTH